jgi:inosose dehydratase
MAGIGMGIAGSISRNTQMHRGSSVAEGIKIACGQITWRRGQFTLEQILKQIAEAGYDGAPASAPSPEEVNDVRATFDAAGLEPAPAYLGAEFWDGRQADEIVRKADRIAHISKLFGLTEVYVAANLTPERRAVSGHVQRSDALSGEHYDVFAQTLNRVGEATLRHGVRASFHNHVGSFIETRSEIDDLFARVDPALVFHGPDIGHLAWAGDDVLAYVRDYVSEITTLHIKDIDPQVLAEGVAKGWDYSTFSDHGIFTELGQGFVDFPALFDILRGASFQGWIVVETDVTQRPTALESASVSRAYLRSLDM